MPDQLQLRGGTTSQHASFTGASKEVTVDTTKKTLVVHDGSTAGGNPLLREDQSNLPTTAPTRGIYNASGSLAISTGGSGRLFVDSNGNLGVGISSIPNYNSNLRTVSFNNTNGVVHDYAVNGVRTGSIVCQSTALELSTQTNVPLVFSTNSAERMRLDSSGRLGVGTSVPGALLSLGGSIAAKKLLVYEDAGNNAYYGYGIQSGEMRAFVPTGGNLTFGQVSTSDGTTYTERMRLDSSGRLGIGTTPGAALDVAPDANRNFQVQGKGGTTYGLEIKNGTANSGGEFHITAASAGGVVFNRGSTEMGRFDGSSRLLVGTSTARSNFYNGAFTNGPIQVEGASYDNSGISLTHNSTNALWSSRLVFARSNGATVGSNTLVANGDGLGDISYLGNDGTEFVEAAKISAQVDGTPGANDMPGRLVFSVTRDGSASPTEALRLRNTGYLTQFASGDGFRVSSAAASGTATDLFTGAHSATAVDTGTISFRVSTNGNATNTNNSYAGISDIKLKENIVDAHSQWNDIKALRPVNYNFKAETGQETHTQLGLIAQEVELISPGLVSESPDRDAEGKDLGTVTKSVNYSVLYMKAVKALQEAMERIEQLETKVSVLEARP